MFVIRSTIRPTGPGVKAVAGRVVVGPVWRVGSPLGLQPRHPGRELEQQRAELPFRQPEQEQPEQPQQQHRPASCEHDPRSVAGRSRTPGEHAGCPGIHPAPAASCAHGRPAGCVGRLSGKEQGAPGFVATPIAWRASRRFRCRVTFHTRSTTHSISRIAPPRAEARSPPQVRLPHPRISS